MNIITIELRKMVAADGMWLTNGESCGKEIYLGKNDSPDNWHEIGEEEYIAMMKTAEDTEIDTGEVTA